MNHLSGGNQKKILLMRELYRGGDPILLANPSLALDINNREEIHSSIIKARNEGSYIIILTDDPEEALLLGDVIIPFHDGKRLIKKKRGSYDLTSLTSAMRGQESVHG